MNDLPGTPAPIAIALMWSLGVVLDQPDIQIHLQGCHRLVGPGVENWAGISNDRGERGIVVAVVEKQAILFGPLFHNRAFKSWCSFRPMERYRMKKRFKSWRMRN